MIAQAQSGTGKTSMIALALCQTLETNKNSCVLQRLGLRLQPT